MEETHTDYFLKRVKVSDSAKSFITTEKEFNTPSKTLKEFVRQDKDCNKDGVYITYIFGKKEKIFGVARMKPISFEELKKEIIAKKFFELEEIREYKNTPVIYMSRAGVALEASGIGWGIMLTSFLDGHAKSVYNHFVLYALINEQMYKSMIKRYGNGFFELYKVSLKSYDEKWGWHWAILREFSPL